MRHEVFRHSDGKYQMHPEWVKTQRGQDLLHIPRQFQGACLDDFSDEVSAAMRRLLTHKLALLGVSGPCGIGKTRMCYAIMRELQSRTIGYSLWSADELLGRLRGMRVKGEQDRNRLIDWLSGRPELVMLDDIGHGGCRADDWGDIMRIIIERAHYERPLMITTNLDLSELSAVDDRLASRMGGGEWISIEGEDRRWDNGGNNE